MISQWVLISHQMYRWLYQGPHNSLIWRLMGKHKHSLLVINIMKVIKDRDKRVELIFSDHQAMFRKCYQMLRKFIIWMALKTWLLFCKEHQHQQSYTFQRELVTLRNGESNYNHGWTASQLMTVWENKYVWASRQHMTTINNFTQIQTVYNNNTER